MSEEPVEEVRVAYRSPNGEILYRTFRVVGAENPGLDSSGAGYVKSESELRVTTDHIEPELEPEAMRVRLVGISTRLISTTHDYRERNHASVEDEQHPSEVSGVDCQDDTLDFLKEKFPGK